ncbi:MAG: ChaN family lipoprotein, partial [Rhodobacteraceae bacterium]|nr:ChaN family lipoprotein [Paracoccaceae bacterium]
LPRRVRPALDALTAGRLDLAAFLEATAWAKVWGFDADLYAPLFEICRDLRLPMRGLNVERALVTAIGRDGWSALPGAERGWLTPARPASPAYRRYLFAVTGGAIARGPGLRPLRARPAGLGTAPSPARWPKRSPRPRTHSRWGSSGAAISNSATASRRSSTISASARLRPHCPTPPGSPARSPISSSTRPRIVATPATWPPRRPGCG